MIFSPAKKFGIVCVIEETLSYQMTCFSKSYVLQNVHDSQLKVCVLFVVKQMFCMKTAGLRKPMRGELNMIG